MTLPQFLKTSSPLLLSLSLLSQLWIPFSSKPVLGQTQDFCQLPAETMRQKERYLAAGLQGDRQAQISYKAMVAKHRNELLQCRQQSWLKNQAIWLRLYECDLKPGVLDSLLDRLVSRGYNQVYIEVFYSGQVLLPPGQNPTPWTSVVRSPEYANRDLLDEAIQKARERGMEPYAWLFSLNYGYQYGTRPDRQSAVARNGRGQTSLSLGSASNPNSGDTNKTFADPYSPLAQQDYANLLQAVLQRRPKGVLFDYIRYPKQSGGASVASQARDLWIFGDASRAVLINRGLNQKGRTVINHYLKTGTILPQDVVKLDQLFPNEDVALWQGRSVNGISKNTPPEDRAAKLRWDLWLLSVAHAYQGIIDFLHRAAVQAQRQGIVPGAVFFPDANQAVGQGYDSRMQPWDRFSKNLEWHPMAYGLCPDGVSCITSQVDRVRKTHPDKTITPAIAGAWGRPAFNRPSLEIQMDAIRRATPEVQSISHFDFSWQDPEFANARRDCKVNFTSAG
ncbi:family 10 glycosylhydrolase [Lyngbya confervoides]|uniref:Family 10 glycosylhydrolase n=1 Tax=Lyngbya confervoides BDU141951 TaxID=1574623 RepID=A0ABD4T7I0_9CYAN|nr:family 10 glycosylhydrolase [Lyngbya confervoides]MCM1984532.1 family 10 glycosylhydrolase [Lyngbya confervoides BDU141951]